jgi:azurin
VGDSKAQAPSVPEWRESNYAGEATRSIDSAGRTKNWCFKISSERGADASWSQTITVEPDSEYLLSCWIKTADVKGATGALLEIHSLNGGQPRSQGVKGTSDWTKVSFRVNTEKQTSFMINLLFGGWGRSTGTAWYDEISCVKVAKSKGADPAPIARTFGRLATPTQLQALNVLLAAKPGTLSKTISDALHNPAKPKVPIDLEALAKTHQVVHVSALEGLKYDVTEITAKVGTPVALVFHDADQLQHNLVVAKPGAFDKCCAASDAQAAQPDAISKNYIPDTSDILYASKLLNPGELEVLKLDLKTPGEYPYFCTFPGHCHVMRGTIKVNP